MWSNLPVSATRWLSSADSSHPRATQGREDCNTKAGIRNSLLSPTLCQDEEIPVILFPHGLGLFSQC